MARIVFIICTIMMIPGTVLAEGRYFLGTRTGWQLSGQAFLEGRYKDYNLFIVIGANPTTDALHDILGWKSNSTYVDDIKKGAHFFGEQVSESADSVPDNCKDLWKSTSDLFIDPVDEFQDLSLLTPARIVYKTVANTIGIGWYGAKIVVEPVARVGAGLLAMVGSPFIKPVTYTSVAAILTGTAVYGYTSSAVAGGVMVGATGTTLVLDVVTSPAVAVYEAYRPDTPPEKAPEESVPVWSKYYFSQISS